VFVRNVITVRGRIEYVTNRSPTISYHTVSVRTVCVLFDWFLSCISY